MAGPVDPRVLPHLRVARAPLSIVLACGVAGAGLLVAQAFALTGLVVALVRGEAWTSYAVALALVVAGRALVSAAGDVAASSAAARVGAHLRDEVLADALRLDAGSLARHRVGELALLATRGVAAVEPYLTRYVPALVLAAVLPLLTLAAIATQDLWAALVVAATLPLVPVFAALVGLATRDRVDRQWRALGSLSGHFVDVVRGLPTLVAHRRASAQSGRIAAVTDRYRRANRDVLRLAFASSAVLELVATLSVALVAVTVGLRLAGGGLDLETALVVLLLAPEAYWPLRRVGAEYHAAAEGTATFEAIHALADSRTDAEPVEAAVASARVLGLVDATVTWPGRTRTAVGPVTTAFPARGLVAVTGPSGCGKSTLLAALLGEVPLASGRVLVPADGLEQWRARVAHLGQTPWLVPGTVADNVRVGRPDADLVDVAAALEEVGLDVPLDRALGEDGRGLSAGQRARLALARVLVSDRPYVLLDEPTAHVDAATEDVLVRVVRRLARSRCVVVVAHRPALVEAADVVVQLPAPPVPAEVDVTGVTDVADERVAPPSGSTPPGVAGAAPSRVGRRLAGAVALGVLASTSGVALTATAGWLIVRSSEHPPVLMLLTAIVGVRTFGLARPVFRYVERLVSHDVALRLLARRRARVYDDLVPLVPGRLGRRGDVLASVVDDVDAVVDDVVRVRVPVLVWLGTTVLTAAVAALFLPAAATVVAATGLLAGAGSWAVAALGSRRHGARRVAARGALSTAVLATLQDARELVLWQADGAARREVGSAGDSVGRAARGSARWAAVARAWPLLVAGAGVLATAHVAVGHVSGPVLALLVLAPLALAEVAAPLADAGALRHETRAATARLDALAAAPPAVVDPASPLQARGSEVAVGGLAATWDGEHTALRDVSLTLRPGRAVGVVGPSGSGKSTLAAVLVRFLERDAGGHDLGGVDVRDLAADDVRRVVGLLDDEPYLFATSVLENVRLARPDATDAEVLAALRAARLDGWLASLPRGLDTRLGDGADAVSGGERARIGLARLLLADHRVLVLDEPTAHLDHATATAVADDLLALRDAGRSLVWITHTAHGLDRVDDVLDLGSGDLATVSAPGSVATSPPPRPDPGRR
jgi:ATP-binding cassette subfamily C protein CydCD